MKFQKVILGALLVLLVLVAQAQAQMVPRSVTRKALLPPPARAAAPIAKPAAPTAAKPAAPVQSTEIMNVKAQFLNEARQRWKSTDNEIYCALKTDPRFCRGLKRDRLVAVQMQFGVAIAKNKWISDTTLTEAVLQDLRPQMVPSPQAALGPRPMPQPTGPVLAPVDFAVKMAKACQGIAKVPSAVPQAAPGASCQEIADPDFYVDIDTPVDEWTNAPPLRYPFLLGGPKMSPFLRFNPCLGTRHAVKIDWSQAGFSVADVNGNQLNPNMITVNIQATGVANCLQAGVAVLKNVAITLDAANPPTIAIPIMYVDNLAEKMSNSDEAKMNPNPQVDRFPGLPPLCPRLTPDPAHDGIYLYDAAAVNDPFLVPYPKHQEVDPDFLSGDLVYQGQHEIKDSFSNNTDGCHELMIDMVKAKFDYEDKLMYVSQNKQNFDFDESTKRALREFFRQVYGLDGEILGFGNKVFGGGISSNFYFVAMPCHQQYMDLSYEENWGDYGRSPDANDPYHPFMQMMKIQPFQHVLWGQLDHVCVFDSEDKCIGTTANTSLNDYLYSKVYGANFFHRPSHRVMSFLPSLFEGGTDTETSLGGAKYTKCEWMDTSSQAPYQEVHYKNLAAWDWALSDPDPNKGEENDCAIVAFVEGDDVEKYANLINGLADPLSTDPQQTDPLIPPNFISSDLIAVFRVTKAELANGPVEKKNHRHAPQEYALPDTDGDPSWDFAVTFSLGPACSTIKQIAPAKPRPFWRLFR